MYKILSMRRIYARDTMGKILSVHSMCKICARFCQLCRVNDLRKILSPNESTLKDMKIAVYVLDILSSFKVLRV